MHKYGPRSAHCDLESHGYEYNVKNLDQYCTCPPTEEMVCVLISILLWLQWTHQHNCWERRAQRCPHNGITVFGTRTSPKLWQDVMKYSQIKSTSKLGKAQRHKDTVYDSTENYEATTLVCECGWMLTTEHASVVYICFNPWRSLILPLRLQKHQLYNHLNVLLSLFHFIIFCSPVRRKCGETNYD